MVGIVTLEVATYQHGSEGLSMAASELAAYARMDVPSLTVQTLKCGSIEKPLDGPLFYLKNG